MTTAEEIQVRKANVLYHTRMAETYDEDSPHFKTENRERVGSILASLSAKTSHGALLDLGAGTGFITRLARAHFDRVVALDMTPAMVRKVTNGAGVCRILGEIAQLPFDGSQFDVCACYGTLHHLFNVRSAVAEAFRCLKPGGFFYSDSDPNAPFFSAVRALPRSGTYSPIVEREILFTAEEEQKTARQYGLDRETIRLAEYRKIHKEGFTRGELHALFREVGFRYVEVGYEWFLGEAAVIHGHTAAQSPLFADHLRQCLPLTESLFKYLRVIAQK